MNRSQILMFIDADRDEYLTKSNFDSVKRIVREDEWIDKLRTYSYELHIEPTYTLIKNQFCFETNREYGGGNRLSFKKYLTDEQIKSLYYWEYEGEKIYSSKIIDRWETSWEVSKSQDIWLVTKELINYLEKYPLQKFHQETIVELKNLNMISGFCKDYNYELIFFDPDI